MSIHLIGRTLSGSALWLLLLAISVIHAQQPAQTPAPRKFDPPRILEILRTNNTGADSQGSDRLYFINKGQEVSINRGDELNVYREKRVHPSVERSIRIFIGTLIVTESQNGSSMGTFAPSDKINLPIIKYKAPMKRDIVVPRLIIDSGVLFNPGDAALSPGAGAEFQKIANFVNNFSPNKLIIEGHTDADGEEDANLALSNNRATAVVLFLTNTYPFITEGMVEARGYGETQPLVPNDSPENKKLNRRIEVIIWE
jgi:outer membrane protein OmpA-like peptidoglycan-associated protein